MSEALINGLAGAAGGIVAQLITYPLQTVNTRQHTERKLKKASDEDLENISEKKLQKHHGTLHLMCQVIRDEGWCRLYGGLMPSLVGTAASQGIYYYFYQIFRSKAEKIALDRRKNGKGDGSVGMLSSLLVAAFSGCLNVLFTNPIWVVVTRMQVQEVYDEAGLMGFWKGVMPTLIMVSNPSIQFMLYETLLKRLRAKRALNKPGLQSISAVEIFLLGALAKLGATVTTYPLLVVKSRLQAKQQTGSDNAHQYTGTLDAIAKVIHHEGLSVLYKGMSTKIVQSVLAAAILFMIKEELVEAIRKMVSRNQKLIK
ncbi:peroxisomal nicotinamide adenine dinucleotide carrier isoform X2 [Cryptomeria japonica]|uniref:peroxisomal nicotinamide adenine dinucleotide carrier isoform X2 n=1 Tax=Cryptomeria japonica TaxID=3369 RepID=UPI0027DA8176|nr:peroxisomal nicotinamide adenine dinucleotide carrier isoform X2 [Cryptomeria japonica]